MIKQRGVFHTYDFVMNKLEFDSPLGYSCAGQVIAVGDEVRNFKVGDYVACGGQGAYHADVVAVYENLAVKVPINIDLKYACFSTLASIAIQGLRQSNIKFGEYCVIIGMGLIGQITYKLVESAGGFPYGLDISEKQINFVKKLGFSNVYDISEDGVSQTIINETRGYGADAVIITAATDSLQPIEFSGEVARMKGKIIVVGSVPTGFSRDMYYKKELELLMSSSYGPGRYDVKYEQKRTRLSPRVCKMDRKQKYGKFY